MLRYALQTTCYRYIKLDYSEGNTRTVAMLPSWIPPRYLIYNRCWVKVIIRWEKSMLLPYALSLIVGSAHSSVTCSWQQCQKHEVNNLMGKRNEHKVNSDGVRLTFVHMKDRRESLSRDIVIIEYSKPIPNWEIWQGWIILCINWEIYSHQSEGKVWVETW